MTSCFFFIFINPRVEEKEKSLIACVDEKMKTYISLFTFVNKNKEMVTGIYTCW